MNQQINNKVSIHSKALGIYLMSLALGCLNIPGFGSLLRYISLIPLSVNIIQIIKFNKIKYNKIYGFFYIYFILLIFSVYYSIAYEKSISRLITLFLFITLFSTSVLLPYNRRDKLFITKSYLWSTRLTAIFTLSFTNNLLEGRLTINGTFFVEDPNYLCGYFIFGIILLLELIFNSKDKYKPFHLIELIFYIWIIFLTGSRGGMLAILASILSWILFTIISRKKIMFFLLSTLFISIFIFSYDSLLTILPLEIQERFNIENILSSNGTGRFDIWEDSFIIYNDSNNFRKLLGYGPSTIRTININGKTLKNVSHNFWIEELLEQGIIGLAIYISINLYTAYICLKNKNFVLLSSFIGMICLSMSISMRSYKPLWNLLIIIWIICGTKTTIKKHKQLCISIKTDIKG